MEVLNSMPKEYIIGIISILTPALIWLIKALLQFIFNLFEKSLKQAFTSITDRLDTMTDRLDRFEDLVRDLIRTTAENSTKQDVNTNEIERLRDRVHHIENVTAIISLNCERCPKEKLPQPKF